MSTIDLSQLPAQLLKKPLLRAYRCPNIKRIEIFNLGKTCRRIEGRLQTAHTVD